ncbi:MAG: Gentisate 1,2-dioxygenase /1-hydroxy-2-naphthoate dioxygenase [Rhodospirillales bacterium]|nr:Gentisate 1,2-dioxygenase /1-hydroxy-2-naphthoate dioxygenase [Rhodospirillales bacterium]
MSDSALDEFNKKVAASHLIGNWLTEPGLAAMTDGPKPQCAPHLWQWQMVRDYLIETFSVLPETDEARRVLTFLNPMLPRGTTLTLSSGIQLIGPGEIARAHQHSINALRFVIEGHKDLHTVVDGVVCPMEDYDLILTPSYSFHDHENRSGQHVAWLDVLDVTLYARLNQMFFMPYEGLQQPRRNFAPDSEKPLRFPWVEVYPRLLELAAQGEGDPHDGIVLEYLNADGTPLFPTMTCTVQMLKPGQATSPQRRTTSSIHFVIGGEGCSTIGDAELAWGRHDTFAVPNWLWQSHRNSSPTEPALLFVVHDTPAIRALGMYREEKR